MVLALRRRFRVGERNDGERNERRLSPLRGATAARVVPHQLGVTVSVDGDDGSVVGAHDVQAFERLIGSSTRFGPTLIPRFGPTP